MMLHNTVQINKERTFKQIFGMYESVKLNGEQDSINKYTKSDIVSYGVKEPPPSTSWNESKLDYAMFDIQWYAVVHVSFFITSAFQRFLEIYYIICKLLFIFQSHLASSLKSKVLLMHKNVTMAICRQTYSISHKR